jgi:alpha-galactosidase
MTDSRFRKGAQMHSQPIRSLCAAPSRPYLFRFRFLLIWASLAVSLAPRALGADTKISNDGLMVTIHAVDGTYSIAAGEASPQVIRARVAAEVDHGWIESTDYPRHDVTESDFEDSLGRGRQAVVSARGLNDRPDLIYTIRVYEDKRFGVIQVRLQNSSGRSCEVESIRPVNAIGVGILDLHGSPARDRILSDSYSEDWPPLRLYDLGTAPNGMHRAVGSQLVYNRQSRESIFFGALSADRLLTILHLNTKAGPSGPSIAAFTVDSTGTTEIQETEEESGMRTGPPENLIALSLPLAQGASLSSEPLLFSVGSDYHSQLEDYGSAIRELHHSRIPEGNMLGWWSWTAFYMKINEGNSFTNALWQAERLKALGYDWFHFDFGYGYARGDYSTPNASKFPHGMRELTERIRRLGLKIGIWTAPFEVGELSSIYQDHKDWLVHNQKGEPIPVTTDEEVRSERLFVLDTTHPAAQEFVRKLYQTLVREWGVKYIKLDFMDNTAIEGYHYRPNTTALEALRIGLQTIRDAVGDDVLLDKDGSPMLTPVGLVDDGRTSQDTGHTFLRSREAVSGIAARYYMHRNFFIADPDAFTVSRQMTEERHMAAPLTLNEAEVSIALAAVSGGMYEIGDDLPTVGADADRAALLKNLDLLNMARLGRAAIPLDLLSYPTEDELPSIFLLEEDARQSILAVFNWTEKARSHSFSLADLRRQSGRAYDFADVLDPSLDVPAENGSIRLDQPPHSVRVIKIVDTAVSAAAPTVAIQAPQKANVDQTVKLVCNLDSSGVPALAFHWDFGDGTAEEGRKVEHAYTKEGNYRIQLRVEGVDGVSAAQQTSISVSGEMILAPPARYTGEGTALRVEP